MKRRLLALCAAITIAASLLISCALPTSAAGYSLPEDIHVYAQSAILVNLAGEQEMDVVLYEKNADDVRAPGAMMRYMVLAYALHRIDEKGLDVDTTTGTYTLSLFNQHVAGTGVATANMAYGETWTLRDLLTVSFIHNASDAVVVLATAIDETVEAFTAGMNSLAVELGCTNSHFHYLNGLDSLSQYTTARDMYRIVRYCQSFSLFESLIAKKASHTVTPVSGGSQRSFIANDLMKADASHYYSPMVHSRTGLSDQDGRTCAAVALKDGYEYLVVVMGSPSQNAHGEGNVHYRDTKALLDWAFNDFEFRTVLGENEVLHTLKVEQAWDVDRVNLVPAKPISTVIKSDIDTNLIRRQVTVYQKSVVAPIEKGTPYGKVELFINDDQKIGEVELVAAQTIAHSELMGSWNKVRNGARRIVPIALIVAGVVVVLIIAYIVLNIVHNRRRGRKLSHFRGK